MKVLFVCEKDRITMFNVLADFNSALYGISPEARYNSDLIILVNEDKTGKYLKNRYGQQGEFISREEMMELILKYT